MKRSQLEHLIRASSAILNDDAVIIIGSQAILGSYGDLVLPDILTRSIEADVIPFRDHDGRRADLVDGSIGELSPFHEMYGMYAQGVGVRTALLADGWIERLVPVVDPSSGKVGWCLEAHDLCAAKLLAGRPKDTEFVSTAIQHRLVDPQEIARLVSLTPADDARRSAATAFLNTAQGFPESERVRWWKNRRASLVARRRDHDPPSADSIV
jgi:hypothetical protein